MKITAKYLRKNIGKQVEWEEGYDPNRGSFVRSGVLEDVQGKNVIISGDYKWYPDLRNLKVIDPK